MADYENNAYFWQKVDSLYITGGFTRTKKKGEVHDRFKNLIYPVDYGRVADLKGVSENGVSVYAGSGNRNTVSALVIAADILAKELDVKILAGCTEEEIDTVLRFLNQTEFQKTVLIRRGKVIPSWGVSSD